MNKEDLPKDFWIKEIEVQVMPGTRIPEKLGELWDWANKNLKKLEKLKVNMNGIEITMEVKDQLTRIEMKAKTTATIRNLIAQELQYCISAPGKSGKGPEFEQGFMAGLKQAAIIIASVSVREQVNGFVPCPHCGSIHISISDGRTGEGAPFYYAECHDCGAFGGPDETDRDEARKNWNARVI